MYVDKKLQSVLAVQALSRLNRSAPKLGKRPEDLFVLDFFNLADDIKTAFDPFFTVTALSKATDVNVLHELKDTLDDTGIYEWSEVEEFCTRFFDGADAQKLSPKRALTFVSELREKCLGLTDIPLAFPLVPRYEVHGARRRVRGNYVIFYRVEADRIVVLHVLHGAKNYAAILFQDEA